MLEAFLWLLYAAGWVVLGLLTIGTVGAVLFALWVLSMLRAESRGDL